MISNQTHFGKIKPNFEINLSKDQWWSLIWDYFLFILKKRQNAPHSKSVLSIVFKDRVSSKTNYNPIFFAPIFANPPQSMHNHLLQRDVRCINKIRSIFCTFALPVLQRHTNLLLGSNSDLAWKVHTGCLWNHDAPHIFWLP